MGRLKVSVSDFSERNAIHFQKARRLVIEGSIHKVSNARLGMVIYLVHLPAVAKVSDGFIPVAGTGYEP